MELDEAYIYYTTHSLTNIFTLKHSMTCKLGIGIQTTENKQLPYFFFIYVTIQGNEEPKTERT